MYKKNCLYVRYCLIYVFVRRRVTKIFWEENIQNFFEIYFIASSMFYVICTKEKEKNMLENAYPKGYLFFFLYN